MSLLKLIDELGPPKAFKLSVAEVNGRLVAFWDDAPCYYERINDEIGVMKTFGDDAIVGVELLKPQG